MTVVCVVQARLGSQRLPGKVLADLAGRPMLGFLLDRLSQLNCPVVVATTEYPRDDGVAEVAKSYGVAVVRGPEEDVLSRYGLVAQRHPADHVVRVTADCPLTDPGIIEDAIGLHLARAADYTSNILPRTFPDGLDVEVISVAALLVAVAQATRPDEREHVTPHIYRSPGRFRLANLRNDENLGDERWTVDDESDLEFIRQLVARADDPARLGWRGFHALSGRRRPESPEGVVVRPAELPDAQAVWAWQDSGDRSVADEQSSSGPFLAHMRRFAERMDDPAWWMLMTEQSGRPRTHIQVEVRDGTGRMKIVAPPNQEDLQPDLAAVVAHAQRQLQVMRLDVLDPDPLHTRAFEQAGFRPVQASRPLLLSCAPHDLDAA